MIKTFKPTASRIESYVIERVKQKRIEANLSMAALSRRLEKWEHFIQEIENPKRAAKYNLNHINEIATFFKCSPKEFLPLNPLWPLPTQQDITRKRKNKRKNNKASPLKKKKKTSKKAFK